MAEKWLEISWEIAQILIDNWISIDHIQIVSYLVILLRAKKANYLDNSYKPLEVRGVPSTCRGQLKRGQESESCITFHEPRRNESC